MVLCTGLDRNEARRTLGQRSAIEAVVPPAGRGDYPAAVGWDHVVRVVALEGTDPSGGVMSDAGSRLIIVCGLPGSGKTTRAKALEASLHAVRFCPDEWMESLSIDVYNEEARSKVEALQWKLAQKLLALGLTVIIEWGTWGRSERDALRLGARSLGAAVELHYLSAPVDVLFERIQRRGLENPPIERDELNRWIEIFQAPMPDEIALFDKHILPGISSSSSN